MAADMRNGLIRTILPIVADINIKQRKESTAIF
jgi:hypothetical protein